MVGKETTQAVFYPKIKLKERLIKEAKKNKISFSELINEIAQNYLSGK